jgi:SAM-dependent methyltransferase
MSATTNLFLDAACPVCGGRDAGEVRASRYPANIEVRELQSVYCASSDHTLLDRVVRCRACDMVYISPRLDASLIQGGYEAVEDPVFVAQNPQRIRTFAKSIRAILSRTGMDPRGKRLLDVGCAGGAFPAAARDAGFVAQGIEPSRWLSGYGRKTYGLDIRQGILERGVYPESSFDVVTLWDVIEHVPEPHEILTTIHGLLTPRGYLWVNYPDIGSIVAKLMGWRWPFWLSVHLHYYVRTTMRRQLERAGFEVLYITPHWQQLQFGYVMQRAAGIVPPLKFAAKLVNAIGLGSLPFTYNMGQTMVIARKKA